MPPKDERLRTIQAEIDRCVNEMGGLGCLGSNFRRARPRKLQDTSRYGPRARKDTLEAVIQRVKSMRITQDAPLLRALLDRVKPMLVELMEKIKEMDFTNNGQWGELRSSLDTFCFTLSFLERTQDDAVNSVFEAIHDGISEITEEVQAWRRVTDREALFKRIQENIGSKLKASHQKYAEQLPQGIAPDIDEIANILMDAKPSVPKQTSGCGEPWKKDLEQVRRIVQGMNISGGPSIRTLEKLVKPKIDALILTLLQFDLNNLQHTQNLYNEVREFQTVSNFLSLHAGIKALFAAIDRGISTTMPSSDTWAKLSLEKRKDAFLSCLHGIGTEICNANDDIMASDLGPIAGKLYRVGGIMRNISSGD